MKKCFKLLAVLLSVATIFSSCQKELSQEGGIALGNMVKDGNGNCNGFLVQGSYQKDTLLTANNYVDVALNITQAGTYLISSNTLNGYSFRGSGYTSLIGINTFRMQATGKPIAVGTDVFTVKFSGGDSCQVNITVTVGTGGGGGTGNAIFTFPNGTPCAGATQTQNFYAGVPTVAAVNTITLLVNVSTPGAYSLSTTLANGLIFTGSGTFTTAANNQPLILRASGTPTTAGNTTYTFSTTSPTASSCGFDLVVQGTPSASSFTFDCASSSVIPSGNYYSGVTLDPGLDTLVVNVNVLSVGSYTVTSTPATGGPDGVVFSATGVFTNIGMQSITLRGSGTPIRDAIVFYNYSSPQATNTTPCSFSIYYDFIKMSIGSGSIRNFSFNCGSINSNTTVSGFDLIEISGNASFASNPESIAFAVGVTTGSTITAPATFSVNDLTGSKYTGADYTDASTPAVHYLAFQMPPTIQTSPFTVVITFISSNRVEGDFSGTLKDNNGAGPGSKAVSGSFGLRR